MTLRLYPPIEQAIGSFDGGKITEQKPIGFPGEGSAVRRLGPLFYWAWFKAHETGLIPFHPHRGFEIITYVLEGQVGHRDSLGTKSTVGAGGLQVMQTGSGALHEEHMEAGAEGFQIWFEPFMRDALTRPPTYFQYEQEEFPAQQADGGATVKTILGEGSPLSLVADAKMWDVAVPAGRTFTHKVPSGHTLAVLALEGDVTLSGDRVARRDFAVLDAGNETPAVFAPAEGQGARVILIEVPTVMGYLPYNKLGL